MSEQEANRASEESGGGGAFDWLGGRSPQRSSSLPAEVAGPDPAPRRTPKRRRTRKVGKRTDPNYHQASAYVRRDVYRQVQRALLASDDAPPDYSTLVETLLIEWLEEQGWDPEGP